MYKRQLAAAGVFLKNNFKSADEQPPYYHQSAVLWQLIMSINGAHDYGRIAFGNRSVRPVAEYLKEKIFRSSELHWYFSWALCGAGLLRPSPQKIREIAVSYTHLHCASWGSARRRRRPPGG